MSVSTQPKPTIAAAESQQAKMAATHGLSTPTQNTQSGGFAAQFGQATKQENAANNITSFKPKLIHRDVTNDTGPKKWMGVQFKIDSIVENYYSMMRASGYLASALYVPAIQGVNNVLRDASGGTIEKPKSSQKFLNKVFSQDPNQQSTSEKNLDDSETIGERGFLVGESILFGGIAAYYTQKEFKSIFANSRLALAAELGKAEEDVTWKDMFNTDNPVVSTQINRLGWKAATRAVSAGGYLHSVYTGLVLNAINITAERTMFYKKTSYDMMVELVNDAQLNHFEGEVAKEKTVIGLQRILQRTMLDHNRHPIIETEMHDLKPILEDIAQDILDKKIGIESIIGYIGAGIIIPEDPIQSRVNIDYVRNHGLAGMANRGILLREDEQVTGSQTIWERHEPGPKNNTNAVASSARVDKLLEERYKIDGQPVHFGVDLGR